MSIRPLLLLDVDGVLNPVGTTPPPGYRTVETKGHRFHVSELHRRRLAAIVPSVDLTWATTWEDSANLVIGPAIGLPDSPVVRFGGARSAPTWKLPYVQRCVGQRALVWIDDALFEDARDWGALREAPTLMVQPSPSIGLTEEHFDQIDDFVAALRSEPTEGSHGEYGAEP